MDFSKLRYDISKPGFLIDNYPELGEFREFTKQTDDIYLKLAVLISDEESPFVRTEKDYTKIIIRSCEFLKIDDFDFIQALVMGSSMLDSANNQADKVRQFVHLLFTTLNNWAYQVWYNMMFSFHESSLVIRTPLSPDDKDYETKAGKKQVMLKQMPTMQKDLVNYEAQIFPNTIVKKIVTQKTAVITNWPEKMAKDKPSF